MSAGNSQIAALISKFSAENGKEKLGTFFDDIERIDYNNTLNFKREDIEDLLEYAKFKLPFIQPDSINPKRSDSYDLPPEIERLIKNALLTAGHVQIEKCDAIFYCRRPKCL